jgi:hypothetical protein
MVLDEGHLHRVVVGCDSFLCSSTLWALWELHFCILLLGRRMWIWKIVEVEFSWSLTWVSVISLTLHLPRVPACGTCSEPLSLTVGRGRLSLLSIWVWNRALLFMTSYLWERHFMSLTLYKMGLVTIFYGWAQNTWQINVVLIYFISLFFSSWLQNCFFLPPRISLLLVPVVIEVNCS